MPCGVDDDPPVPTGKASNCYQHVGVALVGVAGQLWCSPIRSILTTLVALDCVDLRAGDAAHLGERLANLAVSPRTAERGRRGGMIPRPRLLSPSQGLSPTPLPPLPRPAGCSS